MTTEQNRILAINGLKYSHTALHDIIYRATRESNSDLVKADIARVIAILANAMAVL
jgi:hypothetical protein